MIGKVLGVVVCALVLAGSASALTGADAVRKANACLMRHGAKTTSSGVTGNGIATFGRNAVAYYQYALTKAWPLQNGTATGVRDVHFTRGVTAGQRLAVTRCVNASWR